MGRKKLLENRADLILEAATELFAVLSYEKTTLDEIAERAGISKGSIYLEFDSKEDILFAIIARRKEAQLLEMQQRAAREDVGGALETLKAVLVLNVGAIYDGVRQSRRSAEEMLQSRERLRAHLKPFLDARLALIADLLQQAQRQNEIRPLRDPHRVAHVIWLALRGVLPPYDPTASKLKLQHDSAEMLELLLNGLR